MILKNMKKNKGFTLIELLVVIAIIGLLSTIVLVSLNSARNKAKDTRIKADLAQIRSLAELNADTSSTYVLADVSAGDYATQYTALTTDINAQVAQTVVYNANAGTAYAASAQLTGTGAFWCVDSAGASRAEGATLPAATYACP
ncbi:MAG: Type II secretion system protein G [Parcubacteria group bacterium GW2011_GWA2_39_18]|nr:MAG: Type II secretion system protein G [Parcubacteria group bacterium GW2011_GWA2_39_18]